MICLDRVSIEGLDIKECVSTVEKSRLTPRLLDINVQTKKSQSRTRNLARSENFGVSRQFVSILTEKCLHFCIFSSNPSRLFIIFRLKRPRQCWYFSTNLNCVWISLNNLDASWQISTRLNSLDKNLDASKSQLKSLNYKISTKKKKSWSWPSRKSWHFKKSWSQH